MDSLFTRLKTLVWLLLLMCCFLMSSCVTGRRVVSLSVPSATKTAVPRGSIYIEAVTDARQFQSSPSDPSVPSINGDVSALTPTTKNLMIGRQRNSFGMAMGDIALPNGSSVTETVKTLVEEAWQRRGYSSAKDAREAKTITIRVDEFWSWFTPGMWSVLFEAKIACSVTITHPNGKIFTIQGHGENSGQVASNANWQLAYARAFDNFLQNSEVELQKAGL